MPEVSKYLIFSVDDVLLTWQLAFTAAKVKPEDSVRIPFTALQCR